MLINNNKLPVKLAETLIDDYVYNEHNKLIDYGIKYNMLPPEVDIGNVRKAIETAMASREINYSQQRLQILNELHKLDQQFGKNNFTTEHSSSLGNQTTPNNLPFPNNTDR